MREQREEKNREKYTKREKVRGRERKRERERERGGGILPSFLTFPPQPFRWFVTLPFEHLEFVKAHVEYLHEMVTKRWAGTSMEMGVVGKFPF